MNYSNGFDVDLVLPAMVGRIGWKQPLSGSPVLDTDNMSNISGRYFEDAHALVTVKNVYETQEDPSITDDDFNTYLLDKQKSIIRKALNTVFCEPERLQQVLLYEKWERDNEQVIENTGVVKGYFFKIAKDFGISHQIVSATLYFNENVDFTLYLFKDGKKSPIWSQIVTAEAYEKNIIDFTDLFLTYGASGTKGNKFFLCYFQSELGTAKAIREEGCFNKTLCFQATPFTADVIDELSFNRVNFSEGYDSPGINLEVISFRDHTQRIIRNPNLFDEVVGLEMAADVIETINYSTRSNKTERITGDKVQQVFSELNQAFASQELPFVPGFKARITKEYKRLKETFFPKPKAQTVNLFLLC